MAKEKSNAELKAENRLLRTYKRSEAIASVINNVVKWGALIWIASYVYESIAALAGQTTLANIGVKLIANIKISEAVAWVFGISGTTYGLSQRKVRRDTVQRLQRRNEELEKRIDPNRTSSNLTTRGETRPEDEHD